MRPSSLFLSWLLLASSVASLSPSQFARGDLIQKRQDPIVTDSVATTDVPTGTVPIEPAPTSTPIESSIIDTIVPSSELAPETSTPADTTSEVITSTVVTSNPPMGSSSSATGLLFTQTTPTSRSIASTTPSSSPDNNESNTPFFDSKYHQLIIALASVSAALLVGLIATAVIAFRARADNDLLHDRLTRYEEGIDLPQRGKGSTNSLGGYGRLSLSDPDDPRQSRRSLSESQLKPMAGRRLSGPPMGSGTPGGGRRVTFGASGSDSMHSIAHSGGSDNSPLLAPISNKVDTPLFPEAQYIPPPPSTTIPPPPTNRGVTLTDDGAVRRLPSAPKTSRDSYTDPFNPPH